MELKKEFNVSVTYEALHTSTQTANPAFIFEFLLNHRHITFLFQFAKLSHEIGSLRSVRVVEVK